MPTTSLLTNAYIFIIKGNNVSVRKREPCSLKDEEGLYWGVIKSRYSVNLRSPAVQERGVEDPGSG